jgi:DNA-binding transcriptional LysR family regulator
MDKFKQLETFVSVANKASLSAAAALEGVAPAMIGRRIDALEERLGVKLMVRTTRRINLTFEGNAFLEHAQRILRELEDSENAISLGGIKASGHLRITAPAGFGRMHVAPLLAPFLDLNKEVSVSLELSDRLVDIVNEGFDLAIRIGNLDDSSLVGVKLADNRRVLVASPKYLREHGRPQHPDELAKHNCLTFGNYGNQARGWTFTVDGKASSYRVHGNLECNDGAVLHEWALQGKGLAWRSMWEVGDELKAGTLLSVLEEFSAPLNAIYAVIPQRKQLALRVRLFIDHLKSTWGTPDYFEAGFPTTT